MSSEAMARAHAAQDKYTDMLLAKPNVTGVAVGLAREGGRVTGEIALVVLVEKKVPARQLSEEERIPAVLDGVRVDVQEVGTLTAQ